MGFFRLLWPWLLVSMVIGGLLSAPVASAQARRAAGTKQTKARAAAKQRAPEPEPSAEGPPRAASPLPAATQGAAAKDGAVRAAGTSVSPNPTRDAAPVAEQQSAEGVKTYQFGEIEVEGRLRSPQIIYFLRRVRAEFDAGALGHRSFLRELADTARDASFR